MKKTYIIALIAMAIAIILLGVYIKSQSQNFQKESADTKLYINGIENLTGITRLGTSHDHADIKIYIEGKLLDLSEDKYQERSKFIHVEDGDGDVIHKHANGVTLGMFFRTLGMDFNHECLAYGNSEHCTTGGKMLRMFVNGKQNYDMEDYEFSDLDRILITYGNEPDAEIKSQIASITKKACIQSKKC